MKAIKLASRGTLYVAELGLKYRSLQFHSDPATFILYGMLETKMPSTFAA